MTRKLAILVAFVLTLAACGSGYTQEEVDGLVASAVSEAVSEQAAAPTTTAAPVTTTTQLPVTTTTEQAPITVDDILKGVGDPDPDWLDGDPIAVRDWIVAATRVEDTLKYPRNATWAKTMTDAEYGELALFVCDLYAKTSGSRSGTIFFIISSMKTDWPENATQADGDAMTYFAGQIIDRYCPLIGGGS